MLVKIPLFHLISVTVVGCHLEVNSQASLRKFLKCSSILCLCNKHAARYHTGCTACPGGLIIPLDPFTLQNGATCVLPGSHKSRFYYKDIEDNQEEYNNLLTTQGFQFVSNPGDALMYNSRTLHSTMPNNSNEFRSAILINALDVNIIKRIREVDMNTKTARFDNKTHKT